MENCVNSIIISQADLIKHKTAFKSIKRELKYVLEFKKKLKTAQKLILEKKITDKYGDIKNIKEVIKNKIRFACSTDRDLALKNKFVRGKTMKLHDCMELLYLHDFKCFYCNKEMTLAKENRLNQFVFDRINSNHIHSRNNIICSCLSCNNGKKSEKILKYGPLIR